MSFLAYTISRWQTSRRTTRDSHVGIHHRRQPRGVMNVVRPVVSTVTAGPTSRACVMFKTVNTSTRSRFICVSNPYTVVCKACTSLICLFFEKSQPTRLVLPGPIVVEGRFARISIPSPMFRIHLKHRPPSTLPQFSLLLRSLILSLVERYSTTVCSTSVCHRPNPPRPPFLSLSRSRLPDCSHASYSRTPGNLGPHRSPPLWACRSPLPPLTPRRGKELGPRALVSHPCSLLSVVPSLCSTSCSTSPNLRLLSQPHHISLILLRSPHLRSRRLSPSTRPPRHPRTNFRMCRRRTSAWDTRGE